MLVEFWGLNISQKNPPLYLDCTELTISLRFDRVSGSWCVASSVGSGYAGVPISYPTLAAIDTLVYDCM